MKLREYHDFGGFAFINCAAANSIGRTFVYTHASDVETNVIVSLNSHATSVHVDSSLLRSQHLT